MCTSGTIQNKTKRNHTNDKKKWLNNLFISKNLNFKRFNQAHTVTHYVSWHWTSVTGFALNFDLMKTQTHKKYYAFVVVKSKKNVWMIIIENVKYSKRK